MRKLLLASVVACASARPPPAAQKDYPPTRRTEVVDTVHGVQIPDPYRWLEDEKSPEVQAWMKAQDGYARSRLSKLPGRDAIAKRLEEVIRVETMGAPVRKGTRYFFARRRPQDEKAIVYVRDGLHGEDRVLLNPNAWTKDGSDSLGTWVPTHDGARVAYSVHHNNSDEATLYVIDTATLRVLPDTIEGAKYAQPEWTPEGDAFYYTWVPVDPHIPVSERPGYQTVRLHKLGSPASPGFNEDPVVVAKTGDPKSFQAVQLSKDGRWLIRSLQHGWTSTDVWFRSAGASGWTPLAVGQDARYAVDVFRDRFYVTTNEGAPRQRVFAVDPQHPARADWKEIVPERKDEALESATVVGGKLALKYLKDVASRLELRELDGAAVREVKLPGLGVASNLVGEVDEDEAFYTFESFTQPRLILRTSAARGGEDVFFRLQVPVDPAPYAVDQEFAQSKDGTRVPYFVVHRRDYRKDGSAPAILYGYGGFLVSLEPNFSSTLYPWLERGGVYVLANLRGGSEYGEDWHRAGMLQNKQHVFDDFIAVAEAIEQRGWAARERLAVRGGSNGGLLVSAFETQRPDLAAVVLCGVPLIDMLRYHLYGSGRTWISEYGTAEDANQFQALYGYSPMQKVKAGTKYPATLMLSADADDRVDPMHARKFVAELQEATTGGPVWLRIEKHSGHGGADLVKATVDRTADEYAFALANFR